MKPIIVATVFLLLLSGAARAEEAREAAPAGSPDEASDQNDPTVRDARAAFRRGTDLARSGEWPQALEAFEQSAAIRPHPVTTYNIGYVERALGHYTRARRAFVDSMHPSSDNGPALPADLTEEAQKYLGEIELRLAHVRVVAHPADLAVAIDGRPLAVQAGDEPHTVVAGLRDPGPGEALPSPKVVVLIDPGVHVITLSRSGREDVAIRRSVEPGARDITWELTLPTNDRKPRATKSPERPPPAEPAPDAEADHTGAYVAIGIGAASLIAGTVFGTLATIEDSDLDDECQPYGGYKNCPPSRSEDIDSLKLHANLATAGFVVGAVASGVGIFLLLSESNEAASPEPAVRAYLTPNRIGIDGRF